MRTANQYVLKNEVESQAGDTTVRGKYIRTNLRVLADSDETSCGSDMANSEILPKFDLKELWRKTIMHLPPMILLLGNKRLLAALCGCFVQSKFLGAMDSVLPLFVKGMFHWDTTAAGLIFACLAGPALCSPVVGILSDRYGPRPFAIIGFLGCIPSWVCLRFVTDNTFSCKSLLCTILTLIGVCLTLIMTPLMAEIDAALQAEEQMRPGRFRKNGATAQAFGLLNAAVAIGFLIGPLWAGFAVKSGGWGLMSWTFGVLSGVALIVVFCWTRGPSIEDKDETGTAHMQQLLI